MSSSLQRLVPTPAEPTEAEIAGHREQERDLERQRQHKQRANTRRDAKIVGIVFGTLIALVTVAFFWPW